MNRVVPPPLLMCFKAFGVFLLEAFAFGGGGGYSLIELGCGALRGRRLSPFCSLLSLGSTSLQVRSKFLLTAFALLRLCSLSPFSGSPCLGLCLRRFIALAFALGYVWGLLELLLGASVL